MVGILTRFFGRTPSPATRPVRARRDLRLPALLIVAGVISALGYVVTLVPASGSSDIEAPKYAVGRQATAPFDSLVAAASPATGPVSEVTPPSAATNAPESPQQLMAEAKRLIEAKQFDEAIAHLTRAKDVLKEHAEAYYLVGLALLGKKDYATARDFFNTAIDRDPTRPDSYFAYAMAAEGLGDIGEALSGMRSFLHLQKDPDPYRLKVAQARSAIWEWEARLGRGEWGPTRGIPPGFTEKELQRDGKGVGTKMPIPGTEDEHGNQRYVIRHSDFTRIFTK